LLMTIAMTLLMATSVAMALTITCSYSGVCKGTADHDSLHGGEGDNDIYGYQGIDSLYGNAGEDDLYGDFDTGAPNGGIGGSQDYLSGGSDSDRLFGGGDNDRMHGGDGPDYYEGGGGDDNIVDYDTVNSDIYRFDFRPALDILTAVRSGSDQVRDYGGTSDRLYFTSSSTRDEVRITWVDTSDADIAWDALRIQDKEVPTQSVLVYNYFDNGGRVGRGSGAIEFLHFADKTVGFPASQG
jgi:Ca2+-binding RTX toxin-like protein